MQTGSTEESIFFDEGSFESILAGTNGRRVSGRSAADNRDVINGFWQRNRPQ